jgi:hypothetical protein
MIVQQIYRNRSTTQQGPPPAKDPPDNYLHLFQPYHQPFDEYTEKALTMGQDYWG